MLFNQLMTFADSYKWSLQALFGIGSSLANPFLFCSILKTVVKWQKKTIKVVKNYFIIVRFF